MMMMAVFDKVLNMSLIASTIILIVLCLRLALKKMPKIYSYALWGIVLFRLLCPFVLETGVSMVPVDLISWRMGSVSDLGAEANLNDIEIIITEPSDQGLGGEEKSKATDLLNETVVEKIDVGEKAKMPYKSIAVIIWSVVVVGILSYNIVLLLKLHKRLFGAVCLKDNIYISNAIDVPFVMGIMTPKIYIPEKLSSAEVVFIVEHEKMHILRKDHILRLLGFIALAIHWFNPLVWLAFIVSGVDMEMSCDEAVLKRLGNGIKKDYSTTLLALTTGEQMANYSAFTLAFGESKVKSRIKNVLNYKKTNRTIGLIMIILMPILMVIFASNPIQPEISVEGHHYNVKNILYDAIEYSFSFSLDTAPSFSVSSDNILYSRGWHERDWTQMGKMTQISLTDEELLNLFKHNDLITEGTLNILSNLKTIYSVDHGSESFNLILVGDKGDLLLTYGYRGESEDSIRWLFELETEKAPGLKVVSNQVWQHRTKYVGNNSAVGNIISALTFPQDIFYDHFSLKTSEEPFGIAIELKDAVVDTVSDEMNNALYYEMNACVIFSLVENVDTITFRVINPKSEIKTFDYTRAWAEERTGLALWDASEFEENYSNLIVSIKEKTIYVRREEEE